MVLTVRGLVIALLAIGASACGGYAELPIQVREQAQLSVEAVSLHPGAVGTVQIALQAPDDVVGPPSRGMPTRQPNCPIGSLLAWPGPEMHSRKAWRAL